MLISALCNLSVMVALGLMTGVAQDHWGGVKLMVNVGEGDSSSFDFSPLEDAVELEVTTDNVAALGPISTFDPAVSTSDVSPLEALSESAGPLSGLEGLAMGGEGENDGDAGAAATDFFGIGGYGQTFVYVVDASDSMNENGKFDRARYELLQSIEQLASDQRYFVIFYNDVAYPMDADEPVLATEKQFAETADWVNHARADRGTNPLPALLHALSMRPDAVYFLSDGQFDPLTIQVLRMRNRPTKRIGMRQIPIHTVAFVDSGGEHRFVK